MLPNYVCLRAVVNDDDLERGVLLPPEMLQTGLQLVWPVVGADDNADIGRRLEGS
jgi:hypothetical protein